MFHMTIPVPHVRVLQTTAQPSPAKALLHVTIPTPYLSFRLCAVRRLDLLMSRRVRGGSIPDLPPFC